MIVIKIAVTAIRKRIERIEKTTLIDSRMILSTLLISIYTPTTLNTEIPL